MSTETLIKEGGRKKRKKKSKVCVDIGEARTGKIKKKMLEDARKWKPLMMLLREGLPKQTIISHFNTYIFFFFPLRAVDISAYVFFFSNLFTYLFVTSRDFQLYSLQMFLDVCFLAHVHARSVIYYILFLFVPH